MTYRSKIEYYAVISENLSSSPKLLLGSQAGDNKIKKCKHYLLNLLLDLLQKLKFLFAIDVVRIKQAFLDLNKSPDQFSLDYLMKGFEFEEEKGRKGFKIFLFDVSDLGFIYQRFNQNKSVHLSDLQHAIRHLIKDQTNFPYLDGYGQVFQDNLPMVIKLGKVLTFLEKLLPLKLYDDSLII